MKRKLNIHVMANYFLPARGGMETTIDEVFSRFVKMGWSVTVHTTTDLFFKKDVLPKREVINGISVRRYKKTLFGFFPKIDWKNADVICFVDFNITPPYSSILIYASILKLLGKKKFVLLVSPEGGYAHNWKIFPPLMRFIKRAYHKTLGVVLVNFSVDILRTISLWEKKAIESYGIRKDIIRYIPPGLENGALEDVEKLAVPEIKNLVKKMKPYAIQVGRIHHLKNYHAVIKVLPKVRDLSYLIVGPTQEADYKEKLEGMIDKLGLKNRVLFLGIQDVINKYYLIKHAEMMVHLADFESFGIVLLEGMSQGTICITTNEFAAPYVVKNNVNGYCINAADEDKLIEKINLILDGKNKRVIKQMRKKNIEQSHKLTWNKTAADINKELLKIIRRENVSKEVEDFYLSINKTI